MILHDPQAGERMAFACFLFQGIALLFFYLVQRGEIIPNINMCFPGLKNYWPEGFFTKTPSNSFKTFSYFATLLQNEKSF